MLAFSEDYAFALLRGCRYRSTPGYSTLSLSARFASPLLRGCRYAPPPVTQISRFQRGFPLPRPLTPLTGLFARLLKSLAFSDDVSDKKQGMEQSLHPL